MSAPIQRDFLNNPAAQVRILCGLLYVPHILFKLNGLDGAAAFFAKAGLQPAMPFVILAIVAETLCAVGLTFGVLTKWVGLLSAGVLAVAVNAVFATKGVVWLWNFGGVEYNVVWATLSLIVALQAWRDERNSHGRNFLLLPPRAA